MAWLRISAAAFLLIAAMMTDPAAAAEESCINNLTPCAPFVNDTTNSIPDTCCNPLKEAIANQKDCLCGYYNTPGMLDSMAIKLSRVTEVLRDCKIDDADPDTICKGASGSAMSSANNSVPEPPASGNAVARSVAGVGVPSLFLLLASSVLY